MRPYSALLVVAYQPADAPLGLRYVEVVQPKPNQLLLQLSGRIDGAQHVTARGLIGERIAAVVESLARLFLLRPVGELVDALVFGIGGGKQLRSIRVHYVQKVDLACDLGRKRSIAAGKL